MSDKLKLPAADGNPVRKLFAPLVAFVNMFGRDDGQRVDGGVSVVELGVDENGRRLYAPVTGPTYDWPPRR